MRQHVTDLSASLFWFSESWLLLGPIMPKCIRSRHSSMNLGISAFLVVNAEDNQEHSGVMCQKSVKKKTQNCETEKRRSRRDT
jgi:hypothetical protein